MEINFFKKPFKINGLLRETRVRQGYSLRPLKEDFKAALLISFSLILCACGGGGGSSDNDTGSNHSATLTWNPPLTSRSGACLSDLASYKLYYGTSAQNYDSFFSVPETSVNCQDTGKVSSSGCGNIQNCSYRATNLPTGRWFFSAKTVDQAGNESEFSNELSINLQ